MKKYPVLIAKANASILNSLSRKWKPSFVESTENTALFYITENRLIWLVKELKTIGYNPYALMAF